MLAEVRDRGDHVLQRRRQDREDNLIVGQLVASQNKVPYNYH